MNTRTQSGILSDGFAGENLAAINIRNECMVRTRLSLVIRRRVRIRCLLLFYVLATSKAISREAGIRCRVSLSIGSVVKDGARTRRSSSTRRTRRCSRTKRTRSDTNPSLKPIWLKGVRAVHAHPYQDRAQD